VSHTSARTQPQPHRKTVEAAENLSNQRTQAKACRWSLYISSSSSVVGQPILAAAGFQPPLGRLVTCRLANRPIEVSGNLSRVDNLLAPEQAD
jgi:hypothetical protein